MVNRMYGWARPGHPRPKGRGSPSYRISSAAGAKKPGCRDGRLPRLEDAERPEHVSQAPPGAAPTAGAAERGQDRPEPKPGAAEARSRAPEEPRRQVRERPRHRDAGCRMRPTSPEATDGA